MPSGVTGPPAPSEIIVEERFKQAAKFLAALRPSDARWNPDRAEWVFRGHADSGWWLVPSQNRRSSLARYFGTKYRVDDKEKDPIRRLYCQPDPADIGTLMAEFVYALEKAGHVVPNTSRFYTDDIAQKVISGRPEVNTQEAVALAQHHELPTYMLDWTRHSNVAAYFAASETVHLPGKLTGDIEVWALKHWVGHGGPIARIGADEVRLWRSTPPRWGNPNLHAQAGLFTWVDHKATMGGPIHPADKVVLAMAKITNMKLPVMRRLKLPQSEVGDLLHLLSHEPVTGASLFPGVGGVVREVRDRMHFGGDLRARLHLPRGG